MYSQRGTTRRVDVPSYVESFFFVDNENLVFYKDVEEDLTLDCANRVDSNGFVKYHWDSKYKSK